MIVVVSCGKAKRSGRHPIGDLYIGGYFLACRSWAQSVTDQWYIVSAKHGLCAPSFEVDNYDMTMKHPDAVTGARLVTQAAALGIDGDQDVYLVGGKLYLAQLREVWPTITAPFSHFGGFGYQLKALKMYRGRLP